MSKPVRQLKTKAPRLVLVALGICIALLSSSCHKLTKVRASEIIRKSYGFPVARTELFQYGEINYSRQFGGSNMRDQKYLEEHGLITFEYQGVKQDGMIMLDKYHLEMTADGYEYKMSETSTPDGRRLYAMKTADIKFIQVTEMQDSTDTSARVEFTWRYTNITPFGVASNLRMQEINEQCGAANSEDEYDEERIFSESVVFVRDDNRWRIQAAMGLRGGLIRVEENLLKSK